jgi:hypothetical protein
MEAIMAKNTPLHEILGIPAPPVVRGFHDYGVRWTAADGPQRESLRHAWDQCTWSWMYWGRKVRKSIEHERAQGNRQLLDPLGLLLAWLGDRIHRPKG